MPYVLITGASSGIGAAFAREYATRGYSLVLSGRRVEKLEELAHELRTSDIDIEILPADLLKGDDVQRLIARLQQETNPVEILVNNAGFGLGKDFLSASVQSHLNQVEVLAKVPLALMHTALGPMVDRGRGRIINVASIAAFTPGGTYSAAKRFLVSISESANLQYAARGVSVTAVCPGLTRSEFHRVMEVSEPQVPEIFWLSAEQVARTAITANIQGKAVVVPSAPYKIMRWSNALLPQKIIGKALERTRNY